MKILQRKQLSNQVNDLNQNDIAMPVGGSVGIDADGNVPSQPVVNVDSRWDNSTTDIPAIMKIFPPRILNKKHKRHDIYESQSLFEEMYFEQPKEFDFKTEFTKYATEIGLNSLAKLFWTQNKQKNSVGVIIVFPKYPNIEFEINVVHAKDGYKIKLDIKLMPWTQFKYNPIDSRTLMAKVSTETEIKDLIINAMDIITKIACDVNEISKHFQKAKQIGDYLCRYMNTTKL